MMNLFGRVVVGCGVMIVGVANAEPRISHLLPGAVRPGGVTEVTFVGEKLGGAARVWTSFGAEAEFLEEGSDDKSIRCRLTLPREAQTGIGTLRLMASEGVSNPVLIMIDDLPSERERGGNGSMSGAEELSLPVAVDGVCEALGYDYFKFKALEGEEVTVDVVAQRIGSRLDSVVRLLDERGREVGYCDDDPCVGTDSRLVFRAPASGSYFVEVRDVTYEGGDDYRYRLRLGRFPLASVPFPLGGAIGEKVRYAILGPAVGGVIPREAVVPDSGGCHLGVAFEGGLGSDFVRVLASRWPEAVEKEPNDSSKEANVIDLPAALNGRFERANDRDCYRFTAKKGHRLVFRGRTRSLGSPCDLRFDLEESGGKVVERATIDGANEGTLTNTIPADGTYVLQVEELNQMGGGHLVYRIEIEPLEPGFEASTEVEKLQVEAGGTFEAKVSVVRRDYDGPIRLTLVDGDGVELEDAVIAEKENEITIKGKVEESVGRGDLVQLRVVGRAEIGGREFEAPVSTVPALRKRFPELMEVPPELDGLIALGVK